MEIKLFDSELKVMEVLWKEGDLPAKDISQILGDKIGWNKNTTYTVIKKCIYENRISYHIFLLYIGGVIYRTYII